jgi:GMC oxidoreductase
MSIPIQINDEYDVIIAGGALSPLCSLLTKADIRQEEVRGASLLAALQPLTPTYAFSSSRQVLPHTTSPHTSSPAGSCPTSRQTHVLCACTPADRVLRLGAALPSCHADSVSAAEGASTVCGAPSNHLFGCATTTDGHALSNLVMMYTRASASDYDDWETEYQNPGWGSKDLIPLLKRVSRTVLCPTHVHFFP